MRALATPPALSPRDSLPARGSRDSLPARASRDIPPARPPRDTRLDIIRGWMQVSIFISHVAGSVFAWGIHAAWGLSDSSEQFIFLSGLALGSVFTLKAARDGHMAAQRDLLRRTLKLYRTQMLLFFGFATMVLLAAVLLRDGAELMRGGWCLLVDYPWVALPAAFALLYQPEHMGILPGFIFGMLLLGPFLWLVERIGNWALLPSVLVYAAVQLGWVATPGFGEGGIGFDPLAWHLLYVLGGLLGRRALLGQPLPRGAWPWAAVLAVLALGFAARLVEHGFIPGPALAFQIGQHKEILAPARLLHALALAYAVALLVPREAGWMHGRVGAWLAMVGRHSLPVFCLGLYLAWGLNTTTRLLPAQGWWLHLLLVPAGVVVLGLRARLADGGLLRQLRAGRSVPA